MRHTRREAGIQCHGRQALLAIHGAWIPATSMDGGSAEEHRESSPPIPAGMTAFKNSCTFLLRS
ncbi:hypothetical protein [Methyloglobulus sp.]|uniref:hypothetical protein n=1 Tax=Methyloglobulus sp. TaxID=2518622 RepID=UPI00398A24E2